MLRDNSTGDAYFCTAGRGTEIFLTEEILSNLKPNKVNSIDGKVFFEGSVFPQKLLELKCAERVFSLAYHSKNTLRLHRGSVLREICDLLLDKTKWTEAMQGALAVWQNPGIGNGELESKRQRILAESGAGKTFRVSAKCSGRISRLLNPQVLSRCLGQQLSTLMGWTCNPRSPEFEISINIGHDYITAGIPLTQSPLSKRPYLKEFGLRSTICWIMAHLAQIKQGSVVLDPMCGKATILIEAATSWPNSLYVGNDINDGQLSSATNNVNHAQLGFSVCFSKSSALNLPFADSSFDAILCDAPFGQNHKTLIDPREFYTKLLTETHRILKKEARMVVLTSVDMAEFIETEIISKDRTRLMKCGEREAGNNECSQGDYSSQISTPMNNSSLNHVEYKGCLISGVKRKGDENMRSAEMGIITERDSDVEKLGECDGLKQVKRARYTQDITERDICLHQTQVASSVVANSIDAVTVQGDKGDSDSDKCDNAVVANDIDAVTAQGDRDKRDSSVFANDIDAVTARGDRDKRDSSVFANDIDAVTARGDCDKRDSSVFANDIVAVTARGDRDKRDSSVFANDIDAGTVQGDKGDSDSDKCDNAVVANDIDAGTAQGDSDNSSVKVTETNDWRMIGRHYVKLGDTHASICVLYKQ